MDIRIYNMFICFVKLCSLSVLGILTNIIMSIQFQRVEVERIIKVKGFLLYMNFI